MTRPDSLPSLLPTSQSSVQCLGVSGLSVTGRVAATSGLGIPGGRKRGTSFQALQALNAHSSSVDLGRFPLEPLPRDQDLGSGRDVRSGHVQVGSKVFAYPVGSLTPWPLQEPVHSSLGRLGQALQEGAVVLRAVDRGGRHGACSLVWREMEGGSAQYCGPPGPPPV